jgi:hypothetical protein
MSTKIEKTDKTLIKRETLKKRADVLKKPDIATKNFWDEFLLNLFESDITKGEVRAFKQFIQAPNNGFMLQNILTSFLGLEEGFDDKRHINKRLKSFFATARLLNKLAEPIFLNHVQCNIDTYLSQLKQVNQRITITPELLQVFVEDFLFTGYQGDVYKGKSPLYIALFYPYVVPDARDALSDGLEAINIIKAHAFNLLSSGQQNKNIEESHKALYYASTRLISSNYVEHLRLDDLFRLTTAEDFSDSISLKIQEIKEALNSEVLLASLAKEYDNAIITVTLKSSVDNLLYLRRFFNYFIVNEGNENKDDHGPGVAGKREKYNTSLGIVRLGRSEYNSSYYHEVKNNHRIKKTKVLINSSIKEGVTGESLAESIIVDTSPPCNQSNPSIKVMSARSRNHHIALHNQHIGYTISPIELKSHFVKTIELLSSSDQHEVRLGISLMLFLLTSREFSGIYVCGNVNDDKAYEKAITLNSECDLLSLPITFYSYKTLRPNPNVYEYTNQKYIILRLPSLVSESLKYALITINHQQGILDNLPKQKSLESYLCSNNDEVSKRPSSVSQSIFYYYLKASDGDLWLASLITGEVKNIANTQRHYASCKLERVESLLVNYLKQMFNPDELQYLSLKTITSNAHRKRVGSPVFIKEAVLQEFNQMLFQKIQEKISVLGKAKVSSFELVDLFNVLCFYTDLMIAFSTGMRNVIDPYIRHDDITLTGWTRINDKNLYDGYNTRFVFVPEVVRTHLRAFEEVRAYIIRQLTTRKVIKGIVKAKHESTNDLTRIVNDDHHFALKNSLFLFVSLRQARPDGRNVPHVTLREYTRAQAFEVLQPLIFPGHKNGSIDFKPKFHLRDFKTNMNRHYLRGKLMDKGVTPTYIDAYLGHWHLGTEPWGRRSMFSMTDYQEQLSAAISDIVHRLDFKAITWSAKQGNHEIAVEQMND